MNSSQEHSPLLEPHPTPSKFSASRELLALSELCKTENVTFGMLAHSLAGRAHAFFALIAVVPFLTPIPLPGLSFAFGIYVTLVGLLIAADRIPWVPKRWKDRAAPGAKLAAIFSATAKVLARLEGIVKARRFLPFSTSRVGGALIAVAGVLLAMPFPPGGNFPPAWSILFLSLGIIEEDDICWLIGLISLVLTLALFRAVILYGVDGVRALFA